MARARRGDVIDEDRVGTYHCINRCVRRAYLCGNDSVSGKSYEHRRAWLQNRLEELAGLFAIDVLAFAVMRVTTSTSWCETGPMSWPAGRTRKWLVAGCCCFRLCATMMARPWPPPPSS